MPMVLVVDDDSGVLEVVSMQLSSMGLEVVTARTGRAALKQLCALTAEGKQVDVAIVDLLMPDVDGWRLIKAIKNNPLWQDVKVIVISGHAETPSDLLRIIEFDGVYVEKRAGFVETVGDIVKRVLENGTARL